MSKNSKIENFNLSLFKKEVIKFKGKFAFIIQKNKNFNIGIIDRIKSVPIFVLKTSKSYQLSNSTSHLKIK